MVTGRILHLRAGDFGDVGQRSLTRGTGPVGAVPVVVCGTHGSGSVYFGRDKHEMKQYIR